LPEVDRRVKDIVLSADKGGEKEMRKTLFAILLALALVLIPVGSAFAATSAQVDVTAHPSILSISNSPATWEVNGITTPGSKIVKNTTYYANPLGDTTAPSATVVDGECRFTLTNDGDVNVDVNIAMSDLGAMTNGGGGYASNGATSFGASAYISGLAWPGAAVTLTTGGGAFETAFAPGSVKWGVALLTQTDSFTVPGDLTGTIDLTATES
jgi:hypothetical protein